MLQYLRRNFHLDLKLRVVLSNLITVSIKNMCCVISLNICNIVSRDFLLNAAFQFISGVSLVISDHKLFLASIMTKIKSRYYSST